MTDPALAFNTEHGRYYAHPRTRQIRPSITNIIDQKSKPLYRSGLKAAARYASENLPRLSTLKPEEIFQLVSNPPREQGSPAEIGDIVHNEIDGYVKRRLAGTPEPDPPELPQTAKWMLQKFAAFCAKYHPVFTASEFTVWSDKYGYAGTADLSYVLGDTHVLADIKTGVRPYPEVAMQVSAVANADFILSPDGTESPLPKYDRFAVLHLRPRSATPHPLDHIDEAFEAFLALKKVFDWEVLYSDRTIVAAPQVN
jgi:hypothetical protein